MTRNTSKLVCCALWAALGCCASSPALAMTAADLQAQLASGAKLTVVDIRSPALYAREHVPGAINIPASLCATKTLPPVGKMVIYDSGLEVADATAAQRAATALGVNPGVTTEVLDGGYAGWQSLHALTTRGKGAERESFNYITYAQLKAARAEDTVLYDLRRSKSAKPLTDLSHEFPGVRQVKSTPEKTLIGKEPVLVLIDNADGTAEQTARTLKAGGSRRYVILAGGESILARKGERGLQRDGSGSGMRTNQNILSPGAAK